jgi:hypothetical protein
MEITLQRTSSDADALMMLTELQAICHSWGLLNGATFDSNKENFVILSHHRPAVLNPESVQSDNTFKLLGIKFDTKLNMGCQIDETIRKASFQLLPLTRLASVVPADVLFRLYKSYILPILEYPTPAIQHACRTSLSRIDTFQDKFARSIGLSKVDMWTRHRLAPPSTRRQVALMGLLHKIRLGYAAPALSFLAPSAVSNTLRRTRHTPQQHLRAVGDSYSALELEMYRRSWWGSIIMNYNSLPPQIVAENSVKGFQRLLQRELLHL